jgi:hypothetical protein
MQDFLWGRAMEKKTQRNPAHIRAFFAPVDEALSDNFMPSERV